MKKWECKVCGYIHEGDEPPKECPVCGAGPEYFTEVVNQEAESADPKQAETTQADVKQVETGQAEPAADAPPPSGKAAAGSARKWECTVCGYIHEGDEPPKECPVCGAGPEYFKEIVEKEPKTLTEAALAPEGEKTKSAPGFLRRQVTKHHLHPIAVHTPNGVLPMALVFLAGAVFFSWTGLEAAAFFSLIFVLATMPFVLATGFIAWQDLYKGTVTKIFAVKIAASMIVCTALVALVVWRLVDPAVASSEGRWVYLTICFISVAAAGIAGHLGGKLVFGMRR